MQRKSETYEQTEGTCAELTDVVDFKELGLTYTQGMDLVSATTGRLLVDNTQINLFAAQLHAAVSAGKCDRYLYDNFVKTFGGNAGQFVGQ